MKRFHSAYYIGKILVLNFLLLLFNFNLDAQVIEENEATVQQEIKDTTETHSVLRATLLSTAFPGLGQVYNRKYWKLPIIYGGLGTTTYFIIENNRQYKSFLDAFYIRIDEDPLTTDEYEGIYDERQLIELQNIYRKWRDLSIILTGVVYALNILDAHVDAHLFYYNVDDDLALRWEPTVIQTGFHNSLGVSLKLNFR